MLIGNELDMPGDEEQAFVAESVDGFALKGRLKVWYLFDA